MPPVLIPGHPPFRETPLGVLQWRCWCLACVPLTSCKGGRWGATGRELGLPKGSASCCSSLSCPWRRVGRKVRCAWGVGRRHDSQTWFGFGFALQRCLGSAVLPHPSPHTGLGTGSSFSHPLLCVSIINSHHFHNHSGFPSGINHFSVTSSFTQIQGLWFKWAVCF